MMKEIEQAENRFLSGKPDEPFVIKNDDEAMWALKKIREKKAQQDTNKAIAKDAVEWAKRQNNRLDDSIAYFKGLLTDYVAPKCEENDKFKLVTPLGRFGLYHTPDSWDYDENALAKWLEQNGYENLVETKVTVPKRKLQSTFVKSNGHLVDTKTGEVVDGVQYAELPKHMDFRFTKQNEETKKENGADEDK